APANRPPGAGSARRRGRCRPGGRRTRAGRAVRERYRVSSTLGPKAGVPAAKAPAGAGRTFSGSYVENAKGAVLTWKLTFSKLSGAASAAHIHSGKVGLSGPVVVPLCGPCHSGQSGKATISKTVIAALEGGKAYV